jgi:hypothetical protein
MANIPLNYFRRSSYTLSTSPSALYVAPFDRAAIILALYATNLTNNDATITVGFSGVGAQFVATTPYFHYAKDILVSGTDTTSLAPSKIVMNQYDALIASCTTSDTIVLNVSLLETVNTIT